MARNEKLVRAKVLRECRKCGALVIPLEKGNGLPDMLVVPFMMPMFFVETKSERKGHKLQKNQNDMKKSLEIRQHKVVVIRTTRNDEYLELYRLLGGHNESSKYWPLLECTEL